MERCLRNAGKTGPPVDRTSPRAELTASEAGRCCDEQAFRALGGLRVFQGAIWGRQIGNPGYSANGSLWLRPVVQLQVVQVPGAEVGAAGPFFSADGQSIGFYVDGQLKKVAVSGGATVTIADTPIPFGASWGADDMILYGQPDSIWHERHGRNC